MKEAHGVPSWLNRIWIRLTYSPSWSYGRHLTMTGIATMVLGVLLFTLGRQGNWGGGLIVAGALTLVFAARSRGR